MRRLNRMIFGALASAAMLTGAAGAVFTAMSATAPTGTVAATAIEYGSPNTARISNPTAVEYGAPSTVGISDPTAVEY